MRKTTAERFWAKVQIGAPDDCWEWTASTDRDGYGKLSIGNDWIPAHRYAAGCVRGDGIVVMHTCDNPPCCNPAHLRIGTHRDNVADKVAKGRHLSGDAIHNTKLSDDDVRSIRRRYESGGVTQQALAAEYGVSFQHVSDIVRRAKRASI